MPVIGSQVTPGGKPDVSFLVLHFFGGGAAWPWESKSSLTLGVCDSGEVLMMALVLIDDDGDPKPFAVGGVLTSASAPALPGDIISASCKRVASSCNAMPPWPGVSNFVPNLYDKLYCPVFVEVQIVVLWEC